MRGLARALILVSALALFGIARTNAASGTRSCAPIRGRLSYSVTIKRGSVSCATARHILRALLFSAPFTRKIGEWTCKEDEYGGGCRRGGHNLRTARDYIRATTTTADLQDAAATILARTAQTAAETFATDHNGSYAGMNVAKLQTIEPTISSKPGGANSRGAYLSLAEPTNAGQGYVLAATAATGDTYTIAREQNGSITRTCTIGPGSAADGPCAKAVW